MSIVTARTLFDEPVTDDVLRRAVARGHKRRSALHASAVQYMADSQSLRIGFSDLSAVILPAKNHPELSQLNRTQLDGLVLGFAGSAICLAEQDLHISIAGLVSAKRPTYGNGGYRGGLAQWQPKQRQQGSCCPRKRPKRRTPTQASGSWLTCWPRFVGRKLKEICNAQRDP